MKNKKIVLRVGAALCAVLIAMLTIIPAFADTLYNDVNVSALSVGSVVTNGNSTSAIVGFDKDCILIFTRPQYGYFYSVPGHYIGSQIYKNPYDDMFNGAIPSGSFPTIKYQDGAFSFGYSTPIDSGWVYTNKITFTQSGQTLELLGPPNEEVAILYNSAYTAPDSGEYQAGYSDGYGAGHTAGYAEAEATYDGEAMAFDGFAKIITAPVDFVTRVLNFEILGVNIADLLKGVATIVIIVMIISKIGGAS